MARIARFGKNEKTRTTAIRTSRFPRRTVPDDDGRTGAPMRPSSRRVAVTPRAGLARPDAPTRGHWRHISVTESKHIQSGCSSSAPAARPTTAESSYCRCGRPSASDSACARHPGRHGAEISGRGEVASSATRRDGRRRHDRVPRRPSSDGEARRFSLMGAVFRTALMPLRGTTGG